MQAYSIEEIKKIDYKGVTIHSFVSESDQNVDIKTIESFGNEWNAFSSFDENEIQRIGNEYFDIVTNKHIDKTSTVLDVGCGTGRWSRYIAQHVKHIEAIDPSSAIFNAVDFNHSIQNIRFSQAGVDCIPFENNSFDLVFSLGVLHHIPDTQRAMQACVEKVKLNGYFLVYLYYNFDNRGIAYKLLFQCSNLLRRGICKLPFSLKRFVCSSIGLLVYWPFARIGTVLKKMLPKANFYKKLPLYYYHDKSLHIMKNDSLDRFGTPLEQRFTKAQITNMMEKCGLDEIVFSDSTPYWHAIGKKVK
jgi:ubiquinone/menaquinone biosynthesis C-methylase UbiE